MAAERSVSTAKHRPRLAVVSPLLNKRGGTERPVCEGIARLYDAFEIYIYSQDVKDLDLSKFVWRHIPKLPGPHLLNFLWWFAANHVWRAWDRLFRGLACDLTYSPGVNCLDADAISVHIVFAEYVSRVKSQLQFLRNPVAEWPRLLHRRLYYRLVLFLERLVYTNPRTQLFGISRRVGALLAEAYGRREPIPVLYTGIDHEIFSPQTTAARREEARKEIGISENRFAVLVIGNDWRNKGVPVLAEAVALLKDLPIHLLVVSRESVAIQQELAGELGLEGVVHVLPPRRDVEFYYAAADTYAGPSLEDAFALPVAEAMACGLPVMVSARAGASEIVTHGIDGLILEDPQDAGALAAMIRRLYDDRGFRERLGQNAAATARQYTWERAGRELAVILEQVLRRKSQHAAETVEQQL